jgi:predicted esterase YcpF (UPF0227 family)
MAIIYLHGFASIGASPKVDALRAEFPDETVVAPNLPPEPRAAIRVITEVVQSLYQAGEKKILFMGTSMGGFYAWYCGARFDAPAIMVNPSIRPHETTAKWIGANKNYGSGETFHWEPEYLDQLNEMVEWVNANYDPAQVQIVVALDDAVLDAHAIVSHFDGHEIHKFDKGGHRFDNWQRVLPIVRNRHETITEQFDPTF